jgi:acyl carrier protein
MSNDALSKVRQTLKEIFGVEPDSISLETKAFDIPGWDSVGHLSLCGALEEAFDIQFDGAELADMDNVRSIISVVERKKGLTAEA